MPINETGMGYSDKTPTKEADFYYLINLVAGKVRGYEIIKNTKLPFYYIDTHAGSGYNWEIDCEGSPIVGLKAIRKAGLAQYQLILIDKNKKNCKSLKSNFLHDQHIIVRNNDCRHVLKLIGPSFNGYGIMVVDPNGDPFFEDLAEFFNYENTSKLDLCIRLGATSWKRVSSAFERDDLHDCLTKINKNNWYLKRPEAGDPFQWTTIFGTNNPDLKPAIKKGFININTSEGECTLNILNHTRNAPIERYKAGQTPLTAFFWKQGVL